MSLTTTIKNMLNGTPVDRQRLLKMAITQEQNLQACRDLLGRCASQVGMHLGGEIEELEAKLNGQVFNEKAYNYDRQPDGQE
jgi:hypothetical protein